MQTENEKTKEKAVREPLFHIVKRDAVPWWQAWLIRAGAIFAAMVVTAILALMVLGKDPFFVFGAMFEGVFSTSYRFMIFLRSVALLLLVALAITPAFKMKFWNIGAEGQALMGAFLSVALMRGLGGKMPDGVLILLMFLSSILAGAVWAVIPSLFKAKWNTNETLFTLMMNYVAIQIVLYFIKVWVPSGTGVLAPIPYGNLPKIGGEDFWMSIIVAAIVTALMYVYLRFSKHGYEISVVGESENTARYIGINVKKVVIRTLAISGALCGLVGFLIAAGIDHTIGSESIGGMGFTAILVSWLAKFNPVYMIFTAALVIFLQQGTAQLMSDCGVTNTFFSNIVTGLMFFFIIGCEFFILYKLKFRKSTKKPNEDKEEEDK